MTDGAKGLGAMVAAATIWGLSGMYYKALDTVAPLEVLSHRILWSAVFFGGILCLRRQAGAVWHAFADRRVILAILVAAVMIAANWFLFIHSIHSGHALEASLGYYCFPLVAVALGFFFFRERFSLWQGVAIALATFAVVVLTFGLGKPPWIALVLAGTFGCYGLVKKRLTIEPMVSVFVETLLFVPLVAGFLAWAHFGNGGAGDDWGRFGQDTSASLLLVGSGPLTATPLILMSYAAQRVNYATLGLVQYLNPTLQFTVAVAVFGEAFTPWHAIAFPLIWSALAIYAVASFVQQRSARRRSMSVATSGMTVK
ncbi:EamA family transporter RarD [Amaricoccus macauensis]|uniref:EamA family transporter RarD n=1 Tax=Amaricoccus macauensis TaxID=57001 RepID=UPI003C7BA3BF